MEDTLTEAVNINLSEIMEREQIDKIERFPLGRFTVVLRNGSIGVARSVGGALADAKSK
jgi:hypothetical protein